MDAVRLTHNQQNTVISAGALSGPMHRRGSGHSRSLKLTPGGAMSVLWNSDDRDVRQKVRLDLHKLCLAAKQNASSPLHSLALQVWQAYMQSPRANSPVLLELVHQRHELASLLGQLVLLPALSWHCTAAWQSTSVSGTTTSAAGFPSHSHMQAAGASLAQSPAAVHEFLDQALHKTREQVTPAFPARSGARRQLCNAPCLAVGRSGLAPAEQDTAAARRPARCSLPSLGHTPPDGHCQGEAVSARCWTFSLCHCVVASCGLLQSGCVMSRRPAVGLVPATLAYCGLLTDASAGRRRQVTRTPSMSTSP